MTDIASPIKPTTPNKYRTRRLPFIFYVPGFIWRHKAVAVAMLGGLYVADRIYGPDAVSLIAGKPLITHDIKFCQTEACTSTARTITSATALWIQTVQGRPTYSVPDYLNARYAIGSAGIESDMGASPHTKGSRYEGLFQLSRKIDETHFTFIAAELFESLKAAYLKNPNAIPALNEIKIKGKKITPQQLQALFAEKVTYVILPKSEQRSKPLRYATNELLRMLRTDAALFRDPIIQTFAFMEATHKMLPAFSAKPHFMQLPEAEKHAIMYLGHNLPRMANVTLKQQYCEKPVAALSPKDIKYFAGNSGLYSRDGIATPAQVKFRVMHRQYSYLNFHGPKTGEAKLAQSTAPIAPTLQRDKGLFHYTVVRSLYNKGRCIPSKLES